MSIVRSGSVTFLMRRSPPAAAATLVAWVAVIVGVAVQSIAEDEAGPAMTWAAAGAGLCAIAAFGPLAGRWERAAMIRSFAACSLAAAAAAVLRERFGDPGQLFSDPQTLYEFGASADGASAAWDARSEAKLVIAAWRLAYDAAAAIGIPRSEYVGISLNSAAIAASCGIAVAMVRAVFGDDSDRLRRAANMSSTCGLFLWFAGTHLRDAYAVLGVAVVSWACLRAVALPRLGTAMQAVAACSIATPVLGEIRSEFRMVPACLLAGTVISLIPRGHGSRTTRCLAVIAAAAVTAWVIQDWSGIREDALGQLERAASKYAKGQSDRASVDSAGVAFVVSQPLTVRLLVGVPYIVSLPVPFWKGIGSDSAADLFRTLNAFWTWWFLPAFAAGSIHAIHGLTTARRATIFAAAVAIAAAIAAGAISLEARHIGPFIPLAIVPAVSMEAGDANGRSLERWLRGAFLAWIALLHLAQAVRSG